MGSEDAALDDIFEAIDGACWAGQWEALDLCCEHMSLDGLSTLLMVCILSATLVGAREGRLPSRALLFERVKQRILEGPDAPRVERLLRRLEQP